MKKIFFYSISLLSVIFLILGFLKKRTDFMIFAMYLHLADATYVSLDEYKNSKKITAKTVYYPSIFLIITVIVTYQIMKI